MLKNAFLIPKESGFEGLARLILLSLFVIFLIPVPSASAAAPVIATTWTIANGAESPPVYLDGTGFGSDNDKFDFTVDMGTTGLTYDSVAYVNSTLMRFNFNGKANAGIITIQANASAFLPIATDASNTLSVCTIDFLKIHAVADGRCSITATVNGNLIYSQAIPVTRSFVVLALNPVTPVEPTQPKEVVTNLGTFSYDPKKPRGGYVSVLVASERVDLKKATQVKLLIPPKATEVPVVFHISASSTDEETAAGYFVDRNISTTALSIAHGSQVQILANGGSGAGALTIRSQPLSLLPGLLVGSCQEFIAGQARS